MDYYIRDYSSKPVKFKNKCEKLIYSYNECMKLNNYILGEKEGYKACEQLNIIIKNKCSK